MQLLKRLGRIVFHPFLLAAVSVLSARLQVKLEVLPEEVLAPLLLMEAWAAFVFAVFWLLLKNPHKAGIGASFVVGLSLCFDQFRLYVNLFWLTLFHQPVEDLVTFFLFYALLGGVLYLILRTPKKPAVLVEGTIVRPGPDFVRMNVTFNLMCLLLLMLNLVPLAVSDYEQMGIQKRFIAQFQNAFRYTTANASLKPLQSLMFTISFLTLMPTPTHSKIMTILTISNFSII